MQALERLAGRCIKTSADYEYLSQLVASRTRQHISPTTLKRMGGYLSEDVKTRISTLNILARALGYKDAEDFKQSQSQHSIPDSDPVHGLCIDSAKMPTGATVQLAWQPDRECTLRYLGKHQWVVTESVNTRLRKGQQLICHYIIDREPLEVQLISTPDNPDALDGAYICGRKHGVIIKNPFLSILRKK